MKHVPSWLVLVGLSMLSVWQGRVGLALGLAAVKVALLGLDFMELRWANPALRWGFLAFSGAGLAAVALVLRS